MNTIDLRLGNCLDVMKTMEDDSVDSIVTDPPYKFSFVGTKFEYEVPSVEIWQECLRVLKPGGHLLAFAGTRTQHRMAVSIEDAGFEIRDMIAWVYGSGFPKSLDISKAIDKAAGVERETIGTDTIPSTDAAKEWDGWGTTIKPAIEPITVARKPLSEKSVIANVIKHGTGGINLDGCRVETLGRLPSNLIHDGSEEVVSLFPDTGLSSGGGGFKVPGKHQRNYNKYDGLLYDHVLGFGDSGSAARFFYCPKASRNDRDEGLEKFSFKLIESDDALDERKLTRANIHPTVKPTELMTYLVRLVTPPNGITLDPFMGSGSTGKAAIIEGFNFIGIEMNELYMDIAKARIEYVSKNDKHDIVYQKIVTIKTVDCVDLEEFFA